ncbi:uncharacterized protein LOC122002917 isoform X1 [Zingiber officinale]|uniref:uncharacterized protein LOC122002917 isoform X1 n=1 Tax=Zingiber officinale TaxID=94328 RepID=UPI001C4AEC61|nr:uncharacterized protein LOC122002917 isoform X1 [Zingiber officinale]XP_042414245.1 uncharacterized protein LOC122002917 isoform X1 [Zingiber officinale]
MGVSTLLIASIAISVLFIGVWADAAVDASDSALTLESEQLRSKILALESSIADTTRDLKSKDESIGLIGKTIEEKSRTIQLLQSEIEALQKEGDGHAEELVKKANARADELEKQVEKLTNKIELQNKRRAALDDLAHEAEKKVQELHLKCEKLQKANEEQKIRISKTEYALQVAEEELMRAQLEATTKSKVLAQVHGAWSPPWLGIHIDRYQEILSTHWKDHAKPALDSAFLKVLEKAGQARKWAEPHFEIVKIKWIPAIKEQWSMLAVNAEPYVQIVSAKTAEVYHVSKITTSTYAVKVHKLLDPYLKVARKVSKPYINQIATLTKPHVETLKVALRPYTKPIVQTYRKLHKSTTTYHRQAQAGIYQYLKKNDFTKSLAFKELVWFMASALLVLPVFLAYRLLCDVFGINSRKTKRPTRNHEANHKNRRPKRRYYDK